MLNVIGDRLKHFWSHAFTQHNRELCHCVWLIAFVFHFDPSVDFEGIAFYTIFLVVALGIRICILNLSLAG